MTHANCISANEHDPYCGLQVEVTTRGYLRPVEIFSCNIEERDALRKGAIHLKAGMSGVEEGHDPHNLDVTKLVRCGCDNQRSLQYQSFCTGVAERLRAAHNIAIWLKQVAVIQKSGTELRFY